MAKKARAGLGGEMRPGRKRSAVTKTLRRFREGEEGFLAMARPRTCWLVKSEPDCFSIDDLAAAPHGTTCWSGVRNYQSRNFMRDGMKRGDEVLYYHSNTEPPAIVGRAVVAREAYPDHTALDAGDDHFDPKATAENPIWQMVDIRFVELFPRALPLEELRGVAALKNMELLKRGSRLSVQPVGAKEFDVIVHLAHAPAGGQAANAKAGKRSSAGRRGPRAARKPAARRSSAP